jgi:hypothetical protein
MAPDAGKTPSMTWRNVPATVWTLGFVSLLMDVSSIKAGLKPPA